MKLKYNDYIEMVKKVKEITDFKPKIGIVLGTGLGSFVNRVDIKASIYYKDIPGLPISTNPAHQGRFIFGYFNGIPCVFMQGRVHYYEGFEAEEVIRPIRLMGVLGIEKLTAFILPPSSLNRPKDVKLLKSEVSIKPKL